MGGMKRNNPGRSKFGCLVCREKHVKCDEQLPACRRCERLGLTCQPYWLKPKRAPKRPSPKPRPLRPKGSSPTKDLFGGHDDASCSPSPSPSASNGMAGSRPDEAEDLLLAACPEAPDTPELPHIETYVNILDNVGISGQGLTDDLATIISCDWIPPIHQPLSVYHISLPNSLVLCKEEFYALKHYETTFATTQTCKDPQWSFPKLLLHQASRSSMTMHFALATALYDLDTLHGFQTNNRLLAHRHFTNGSSMLQKVASPSTDEDYVEILSCFYYIYISMSRQKSMDKANLKALSQNTLAYIRRLSLGESGSLSGQSSAMYDQTTSPSASSAAVRSFICRLIFWLYKEDVYCSFYGCAGDLARHFQATPNLLKDVWEIARPMLQLNWGPIYPDSQCINDIEMSRVVDMTVELASLRFDATELALSESMPPETLQMMETKFSVIEAKFSFVLRIATSPSVALSEMVVFAAAAAAIYYATRLCFYRHATGLLDETRTEIVGQSLAQLLAAAQRATSTAYSSYMFDGLQWALFVGGVGTKDTIYRDWILSKLIIPRFKSALNTIIQLESQSGEVGMPAISIILCGA
ncbi:hypothetical protein B0T10DRAFT_547295 [Thelonectria olida]|uniref:Zn(2)-C6 fungal-type domain-containing protein n=1 Tax=Thelonectria olida TaxID=1576542 RepID=A0A9P9ARV0_9HYPO|nr:hypothetical protein B0T10DRAFT_547295 [Thelonectria olida]